MSKWAIYFDEKLNQKLKHGLKVQFPFFFGTFTLLGKKDVGNLLALSIRAHSAPLR